MTSPKFVAVLNKKIEAGKVMNALAHMTVGLVNSYPEQDMGVINYTDQDNGQHLASKWPYIILRADNSNKIRTLRNTFCLFHQRDDRGRLGRTGRAVKSDAGGGIGVLRDLFSW
jgi:hypothetical protein